MTDNELRILGVHDCAPERMIFERKLFPYPGRLEWVSSNRQALLRLKQGDIDVLVSSLNSDAGNGLELASESRKLVVTEEIPPFVFVLMTGQRMEGEFPQTLKLAMERQEVGVFLPKPFSRDDLQSAMGTARRIITVRP